MYTVLATQMGETSPVVMVSNIKKLYAAIEVLRKRHNDAHDWHEVFWRGSESTVNRIDYNELVKCCKDRANVESLHLGKLIVSELDDDQNIEYTITYFDEKCDLVLYA